jgi:hypothetical protein
MKTKKELNKEYKQMKFKIGVFQIRNAINNKIYIDSSIDLMAIWNRQRFQLNLGSHRNSDLQNDWIEFGEDKFKYEILEEIEQKDDATIDYNKEVKILEEMYIEELKPFDDKGYNKRSKK